MRKIFSILCFLILTSNLFGQDRDSIIVEIDSISQFGIKELKEHIIYRAKYHSENLFSNNSLNDTFDNVYVNDKQVTIDYTSSKSVEEFVEIITGLIIKELVWTKTFLDDVQLWESRIKIKAIENELALIKSISFEKFKIEISQQRHKIEKRKQSGELIEEIPSPINYLDITSCTYNFEESNMDSDEMIVWKIYGLKTITFGLHAK
jgi:hypothetical protein